MKTQKVINKCSNCYVDELLNRLYLEKMKRDTNLIIVDEKTRQIRFKVFDLLLKN